MRMAQRTYRAKRADALAMAERKCAKLQEAVRGILSSFEALQHNLTQSETPTPAEINLHVGKAALEIASYTKASGMTAPFGSRFGQHDASSSKLACATRIVGESSFRACLDRAANAMAAGKPVSSRLSPVLLEYLATHPDRPMPAEMMRQYTGESDYVRRNVPMPKPFGNKPPPLFRRVEGAPSSQMVPRLAPPNLQRLEYGLTRTWVETEVPGLTGEWLEAADVDEYLSARGIFLHRECESALVNLELDMPNHASPPLSAPSDTITPDSGHSSPEGRLTVHEPELQLATDILESGREAADWAIFGKQIHQKHHIPTGVQVFASSSPFWGGEGILEGGFLDTNVGQHPQTAMDRHTHVVSLNIDKLIEGLALKTICLGSSPGIKRESVDEAIRGAVVR